MNRQPISITTSDTDTDYILTLIAMDSVYQIEFMDLRIRILLSLGINQPIAHKGQVFTIR